MTDWHKFRPPKSEKFGGSEGLRISMNITDQATLKRHRKPCFRTVFTKGWGSLEVLVLLLCCYLYRQDEGLWHKITQNLSSCIDSRSSVIQVSLLYFLKRSPQGKSIGKKLSYRLTRWPIPKLVNLRDPGSVCGRAVTISTRSKTRPGTGIPKVHNHSLYSWDFLSS